MVFVYGKTYKYNNNFQFKALRGEQIFLTYCLFVWILQLLKCFFYNLYAPASNHRQPNFISNVKNNIPTLTPI